MQNDLKTHLSNQLNEGIKNVSSVNGGDISTAYKVETEHQAYFLKVNNGPDALQMFQVEVHGLQTINQTNTINTPKVLACDVFKNSAFLIMEFIEPKRPSPKDFETLGTQLARLHQCTAEHFGLKQNNFIGRLPQNNNQHNTWLDFYTTERLLPQLKLAKQNGLLSNSECPSENTIKNQLQSFFEQIEPSLLHGDLWSGNYLISENGTAYLIDPAVYFGHSEVDISMSKLFGGFGTHFYDAYADIIPFDNETSSRIDMYQLYYLLVHLNMFGSSYYSCVTTIMKTYF